MRSAGCCATRCSRARRVRLLPAVRQHRQLRPAHYVDTLRRGGVEVHPFATNRKFVNRFQLNFRNHRKIVVVDGNRAFVGATTSASSISARSRDCRRGATHRDSRPGGREHQYVFAEDWHWATQKLPPLALPPPAQPGDNMHCLAVPMGPADKQETAAVLRRGDQRRARAVWITTPYLVPDEAVISALKLAVMRGVDVRILIPSRRDHYVVFEASKLYARAGRCGRQGVPLPARLPCTRRSC